MDIKEQIDYLCTGTVEILPSKNALEEKLKLKRPLRIKLGIDPTSPDLHLGHTVCLQLLKRFQDLGHMPVLLIGGFTAQLGDPSGRNTTRPPLTLEQVEKNSQTYLEQVEKILDVNKCEIVNNKDWLDKLTLKNIINILSFSTVNQMISKEAFGTRLDSGFPLYLHELLYPVLQGYDSVEIKSDIEIGGQDQKFNVLAGRDLQKNFNQKAQIIMLTPLLVGLDGNKKMSKTYNNFIGILEEPKNIYGKVMSLPDNLLIDWFSQVLSLSPEKLGEVKLQIQNKTSNPRDLKMSLAREIINLYYSKEEALLAEKDFILKYQKREIPEDIKEFLINDDDFLVNILSNSGMTASNAEAKRKLKENAIKLNNLKINENLYQINLASED